MSKQIVPTLCLLALASACSSGGGSSSGGTTGGSTTTGSSSSSSSSGGSSGACVPSSNVAAVRQLADYAPACISNLTVVLASQFGNSVDGGGTQYAGNWFMADSTGELLSVYHSKKTYAPNLDPNRLDVVNITNGKLEIYPGNDAGAGQPLTGEIQLAGDNLTFSSVNVAGGTPPIPVVPSSFAALTAAGTTNPYLQKWVHVPAGAYTENYADPVFFKSPYQDGVSLTDLSGNKLLIDLFTFEFSLGNCYANAVDGGFPDLSAGGFNGAYDTEETDDGNINNVLFFGSCGQ